MMAYRVVLLLIAIAACLAPLSASALKPGGNWNGKTAQQWQGRRIYQLLTDRFAGSNESCIPSEEIYCGGTFKGIQDRLAYIKGMGFNAIWISPIPVNYHLGYHGYWATNFFAVNPHFGTQQELIAMVAAARAMDIWVMIDVVVNHVGPVGNDFRDVVPFNATEHYHKECQVTQYDCNSEMVFHCRLADLPDLNQTVPFVKQQLFAYVHWLMDTFGFAGIRADTVMYIQKAFWGDLSASVKAYIVGEVWSDFGCNADYCSHGIDGTLNYPLYYTLLNVFQRGGSMRDLGSTWRQQATLPNPDFQGNFIDNHDNSRFLHDSDNIPNYKSAIAHLFFTNGIPIIYYGTEQLFSGGIDDDNCREALWESGFNTQTHMYWFLGQLNKLYDEFAPQSKQVEERWQDETFYAFIRGPLLVATTNQGGDQTRTIPNLPFAGMKVVNWLNPTQSWDGGSTMTITIPAGQSPLILVGYSS